MPVKIPEWVDQFFACAKVIGLFQETVLIGAWAVNMHADTALLRHSADVDMMSFECEAVARFIAALTGGIAAPSQRKSWCVLRDGIVIADVVWPFDGKLPPSEWIDGVCVVTRDALIGMKEIAAKERAGTRKGMMDLVDLKTLRGEA